MRRSRQAVMALAISGVAIAACAILITILANRDSSNVGGARGPGTLEPDRGSAHITTRDASPSAPDDPPTSGDHVPADVTHDAAALSDDELLQDLELGNVVLTYASARPPAALRRLQSDVAGAFSPDLAAAGQAIVLDRRAGSQGVTALAWRHRLRASDASDPNLRAFAEAWLGQGTG